MKQQLSIQQILAGSVSGLFAYANEVTAKEVMETFRASLNSDYIIMLRDGGGKFCGLI